MVWTFLTRLSVIKPETTGAKAQHTATSFHMRWCVATNPWPSALQTACADGKVDRPIGSPWEAHWSSAQAIVYWSTFQLVQLKIMESSGLHNSYIGCIRHIGYTILLLYSDLWETLWGCLVWLALHSGPTSWAKPTVPRDIRSLHIPSFTFHLQYTHVSIALFHHPSTNKKWCV